MDPCQASTSVLCLHKRPETVHCSTKDVYTSEITFLALHPCLNRDYYVISLFVSLYVRVADHNFTLITPPTKVRIYEYQL